MVATKKDKEGFVRTQMTFVIPDTPHAQQRVRFTKMGRTYSPNVAAEHWAIVHIQQELPPGYEPYTGAVEVDVTSVFKRPKAHFGTGRNAGILKPSAPRFCTNPKDSDNLVKHAFDSMNKLIYVDDRQVVDHAGHKRWADDSEVIKGKTIITVTFLGEEKVGK